MPTDLATASAVVRLSPVSITTLMPSRCNSWMASVRRAERDRPRRPVPPPFHRPRHGAGKVGWNLARELIEKGHEVTVLEQDRRRYLTVEQELEHAVQYGDATELWVLERAASSAPTSWWRSPATTRTTC